MQTIHDHVAPCRGRIELGHDLDHLIANLYACVDEGVARPNRVEPDVQGGAKALHGARYPGASRAATLLLQHAATWIDAAGPLLLLQGAQI
jgi:hypothetical protein